MKNTLIFFATLLLSPFAFAQTYPNCSHLKIENVYMDDDTAKLMKVVMSNSCVDCASGLNGCVYIELKVIERTGNEDTIAASKCMCLWSPNNLSQKTYKINSTLSSLPSSLSNFRFSFVGGVNCACDDVPHGITLGTQDTSSADSIKIFPNPMIDQLSILSQVKNQSAQISDLKGNIYITQKLKTELEKVNVEKLAKGIYVVQILDDTTNKIVKAIKVEKQ